MRCKTRISTLLILTLAAAVALSSAQQEPLQQAEGSNAADFLTKGTVAMGKGKFGDAINHFSDAIAIDPNNYVSYYRRATAALSLGRSSAAMNDFDKIILMNPKFAQAHLQKAKLSAKDGRLDAAKDSIDQYLKLKNADEEGKELKTAIEGATANLKALKKTKIIIDKSLQSGKNITTDKSLPSKVEDCLRLASLILEVSPSHLDARRDRAECSLAKGEYEDTIADWT